MKRRRKFSVLQFGICQLADDHRWAGEKGMTSGCAHTDGCVDRCVGDGCVGDGCVVGCVGNDAGNGVDDKMGRREVKIVCNAPCY